MPATIQDVLKTNIVLVGIGLLKDPDELKAFSESVATDVSVSGVGLVIGSSVNIPETSRRLSLSRDRIDLELSPLRSVIAREYPTRNDLDRLAEVVRNALKHTDFKGQLPQAFGYNIELVYDQDSGHPALQYLADRLFAKKFLGHDGWRFAGGAGKLVFDGDPGRWTTAIEPRTNDEASGRVLLNMNLHIAEQRLPTADEVKMTFVNVWDQAHSFVDRLDESVT